MGRHLGATARSSVSAATLAALLVPCLVLASPAATSAQSGGIGSASGSRLAEDQVLMLREAMQVLRSVGNDVWEGWPSSPLVTLVIAEEREFLINLPDDAAVPEGFVRTRQQILGRPIYARPRTLPRTLRTAFPIDGVPTAVVGAWEPAVETPNEWAISLSQEWFRVLQMTRGEQEKAAGLGLGPADEPAWQSDFLFPYDDPDVDNAMQLLGIALYDFWARGSQMPREQQRGFLAQTAWAALQNLRTVLRLKHGDLAYRYFQYNTWRDGVARYSGVRVARQVARAEALNQFHHTPGFDRLQNGGSYRALWQQTAGNNYWLIRTSANAGELERLSFYGIGHGLAELLDAVSPSWKSRYFEPGVWLDDLLEEALVAQRP